MKKLSLKILDDVLILLQESTEAEPIDLEVELSNKFKDISNRNRRAIIDKLKKDKFIDSIKPNSQRFVADREYQFINFDGLMLLENENGYVGRRKKELFLKNLQLVLTLVLSLSSLVAAVFFYLQLTKICPCK